MKKKGGGEDKNILRKWWGANIYKKDKISTDQLTYRQSEYYNPKFKMIHVLSCVTVDQLIS